MFRTLLWVAGGAAALDDASLRTAVAAWLSDPVAAEDDYGHISGWDTGACTDFSSLFDGETDFNEDISAWNTSAVTVPSCAVRVFPRRASRGILPLRTCTTCSTTAGNSISPSAAGTSRLPAAQEFARTIFLELFFQAVARTNKMFANAYAFNMPLDAWDLKSLTNANFMFHCARAFQQSLGWCSSASFADAFWQTPCEDDDCGVTHAPCGSRAPTRAPSTAAPTAYEERSAAARQTVSFVLSVVLGWLVS